MQPPLIFSCVRVAFFSTALGAAKSCFIEQQASGSVGCLILHHQTIQYLRKPAQSNYLKNLNRQIRIQKIRF